MTAGADGLAGDTELAAQSALAGGSALVGGAGLAGAGALAGGGGLAGHEGLADDGELAAQDAPAGGSGLTGDAEVAGHQRPAGHEGLAGGAALVGGAGLAGGGALAGGAGLGGHEGLAGGAGVAGAGVLTRDFFAGPAVEVAPRLLGCVLSSRSPDGEVAVLLTEVEAYAGEADPASHAYRGPTQRNAVMYGAPGHAYVYFTYGMHFCVNLVCLPEGTASAVLLRAGAVRAGAGLARQRRSVKKRLDGPRIADRELARGPARLCQALGIDRSLNGADVCDPASPLRIHAAAAAPGPVCSGPRVGVSTAASVPWRFWIAGEPSVSAYRAYTPRRRPR